MAIVKKIKKCNPIELPKNQTDVSEAEYLEYCSEDTPNEYKYACIRTRASENSKNRATTQNIALNRVSAIDLIRFLIKTFKIESIEIIESTKVKESSKSSSSKRNMRRSVKK
jgi:hypothetical protein